MEKIKLRNKREEKFTQEQMADFLGMDTSQYNRREKGITKISDQEWEKLATVLKVPIESIYESDSTTYFITNNNDCNILGGTIYNTPEYAFEVIKSYISKLEDRIKISDKLHLRLESTS